MIKQTTTLASILLTALALTFAAAGSAVAGDGKSCGDKKKDDTAAVSFPVQPQA